MHVEERERENSRKHGYHKMNLLAGSVLQQPIDRDLVSPIEGDEIVDLFRRLVVVVVVVVESEE